MGGHKSRAALSKEKKMSIILPRTRGLKEQNLDSNYNVSLLNLSHFGATLMIFAIST